MTNQLSHKVVVQPDENCQYVLATVSLSDGYKMDAALVMPNTPKEFVGCLPEEFKRCLAGAGDDTSAKQTELLVPLIKEFNQTEAGKDKVMAVAQFLVKAADIEAELLKTVTRYDLVHGEPGTVYFLEDYPTGLDAHNKTISCGVLYWCESHELLKVETKKFKTQEAREQAAAKLWRQRQRAAEQQSTSITPKPSPSITPCTSGAAPEEIQLK